MFPHIPYFYNKLPWSDSRTSRFMETMDLWAAGRCANARRVQGNEPYRVSPRYVSRRRLAELDIINSPEKGYLSFIQVQAISKKGFWFKIAAEVKFKPEVYSSIPRIWISPSTEILGQNPFFEMACNLICGQYTWFQFLYCGILQEWVPHLMSLFTC